MARSYSSPMEDLSKYEPGFQVFIHKVILWLWPEHRKESPLQPINTTRATFEMKSRYYKKIILEQRNLAKAENYLLKVQFVATIHPHTSSYIFPPCFQSQFV